MHRPTADATLALLLTPLLALALASPATGVEARLDPFAPSTEFSWFADAVYRMRDGRAETGGADFVQTELDLVHRFLPRLALELGVAYDHVNRRGFIPMAFLEANLWKRGRIEADLLTGVFDVPLGIDYRYHGPQDRWIFTDPMSNEYTWARWNDAGHQFNLLHGNFKLKLMSFAGWNENYTLGRSEAKGFRYEFIDPANESTRAGIFRIRDESAGRAFSGLFADLHRGERNLRAEWVRTDDFLDARGRSTSAYLHLQGPLARRRALYWVTRLERHDDGFDVRRDGGEGLCCHRTALGLRKVVSEGHEVRLEHRLDRDRGRVTGARAEATLDILQVVWFR